MVGSQQWEIDYNASVGGLNYTGDYLPSSSFVTVTAVPEPSTLALAGLGAALACWAARRRSRSRMTERYAGACEKSGVRRS